MSFANKSLKSLTVAIASPLARCRSVIGIPNARTNFPKLCDSCSGSNFLDNSTVQSVFTLKS